MNPPVSLIGSAIAELDTPVLLLNLESMEDNIARMAAAFRGMTAKLRPHAKTHKTPLIAHQQLAAGAIGITCAKLGEAEVLVQGGIRDVLIVSAGGTGTAMITGTLPRITEIQAGSYVFMDGRYQTIEGVDFACTLTLLTTVMSRPTPDRIIIDAGMKTLTHEFGLPRFHGRDDLRLLHLSEEHGTVKLADPSVTLKPGDTLEIVPSHGDTTLNLHEFYYCVRQGRLEAIWPIAARGRSQ